jgi:leucyl-tRNA synthetase
MFGPNFERYTEEAEDDGGPETSTTATSSKGPKAKVAAKATGLTYQFQILESIGVPREEIKKFADSEYWLVYFPPIAVVSPSLCPRLLGLVY